jgi:hypothetical protein
MELKLNASLGLRECNLHNFDLLWACEWEYGLLSEANLEPKKDVGSKTISAATGNNFCSEHYVGTRSNHHADLPLQRRESTLHT